MGNNLPIVHKPLPADDPKRRQPDISKARRVLGWEPKVSLEDGLQATVDYVKRVVWGERPMAAGVQPAGGYSTRS
jgi:nucleoside-diphosphate-sugar epimerase